MFDKILHGIREKYRARMDDSGTKLPYGLCEGEGIDTEGLEPHEAWKAYTEKTGVSANQAYQNHYATEKSDIDGLKSNPKIRTFMKDRYDIGVAPEFSSVAKGSEKIEDFKGCLKHIESNIKSDPKMKQLFKGAYIAPGETYSNLPIECFAKSDGSLVMTIKPSAIGNLNEKINELSQSGDIVKNSSVGSYITGRMANLYADQIALKEKNAYKGSSPKSFKAEDVAKHIAYNVMEKHRGDSWAKGKTQAQLIGEISKTAKDYKRLIGEAFSDCEANGKSAHPFSKEIRKATLEELRRVS